MLNEPVEDVDGLEPGPERGYYRSHKQRVFDLMLEEARVGGQDCLRVGRDNEMSRTVNWVYIDEYEPYDLRTIVPTQVVFDLGDNEPWERTRRECEAVMDVLDEWDVPYWCGLTGGSGVHIEVFLRPAWASDHRAEFALGVLTKAHGKLGYLGEELDVDGRCLDPNQHSRLIREFGSFGSGGRRKTLWAAGSDRDPLPKTRERAYDVADHRFPDSIETAWQPPGMAHAVVSEALGGRCPRHPDCYDHKPGTCERCPLNDFKDVHFGDPNL